MERDTGQRLRKAVKENNLFLVRRLVQKTDMRNPDPGVGRYTSLAWAALCGHEEVFEFLLNSGHDDEELSKDVENNTILSLLGGIKPEPSNYRTQPAHPDLAGSALRMARMYYERYPFTLDWSNLTGKTALHTAALKGNEDFVRMLCDVGADVDLPDLQGNTPLHYASAWGHLAVVQILIERGCKFAARNNEGFTAVDYAYSNSTMATLEESARIQFENNKKARRQATRGPPPDVDDLNDSYVKLSTTTRGSDSLHPRLRSGSGTTSTSESTDRESFLMPSHSSSSSSQVSAKSSFGSLIKGTIPMSTRIAQSSSAQSSSRIYTSATPPSQFKSRVTPSQIGNTHSALTPVATRVRERDADAMAQFMDVLKRDRSGSRGTLPENTTVSTEASRSSTSTETTVPEKPLRQWSSAAQLRSSPPPISISAATSSTITARQSPRLGSSFLSLADEQGPETRPSITHDAGRATRRGGTLPLGHPETGPPAAVASRRSPFSILHSKVSSNGSHHMDMHVSQLNHRRGASVNGI
ncbi:ankyrin [Sistotremastrum niveocremeum HHB9708]|uniref:Ankyrin n=2 Tax=Sistotremastraceae TaxID=3402574 RepID=A0A164ZIY6_9AGAM|nr:ankyrin [Sistotremastrum niveocremeum HHB9708]KZT42882.1 ankyrin [Sistotremastrum suecicum HHB10207 ss-3]